MTSTHRHTGLEQHDNSLWGENTDSANALELGSFIQYLADAVLIVNPQGIIEGANAKAALLLNTIAQPLIGKPWLAFLQSDFVEQYQGLVNIVTKRVLSLQTCPTEMQLLCSDGQEKPIELSVSYLVEQQGRILLILRDLSKHKAELNTLKQQAATDALTGLANRRTFDEQLTQQWQQCNQARRPISVVIIDIDFFKQFNDRYGHIQGDNCLREVARSILQAMPLEAELTARYGGEEFALILPNYTEEQALLVAKTVQQRIRNLQFPVAGLAYPATITVSQGIATEINGQFRTSLALLCAADTALYRAKSAGRDCINTSY